MNVKLIGKHEKDSRACRDGLALTLDEMMAQDKSICYVDCDLMGCINTKQLRACIDRVSLIVSEKLKSPLRCVIGEGEIDMTTKTALGNAHDCCPVEGNGNGLEIGFNNKYMMDALKAAPKDQVTLELSSPITPCIIVPAEGEENFLFMVLPVRLKADF